jgi:hypothetical protein
MKSVMSWLLVWRLTGPPVPRGNPALFVADDDDPGLSVAIVSILLGGADAIQSMVVYLGQYVAKFMSPKRQSTLNGSSNSTTNQEHFVIKVG